MIICKRKGRISPRTVLRLRPKKVGGEDSINGRGFRSHFELSESLLFSDRTLANWPLGCVALLSLRLIATAKGDDLDVL